MAAAHATGALASDDLAHEIADQYDTIYADATPGRIAIVDGTNITITIKYGMLNIVDGTGTRRRERRWSRPNAPERIVILGSAGWIAMQVISWCEQTGTNIVAIDPRRGRVRLMTSGGTPDGRLHAAQANASTTQVGLDLARTLLAAKVRGQAENAVRLGGNSDTLRALAERINAAETISDAVSYEAAAANAYWPLFQRVVPRFAPAAARKIPAHWCRWDGRDGLGNSNQRATTPLAAVLNYTLALATTEVHAAILAMGLSPQLGIVHANGRANDALVSDLIEPLRPHVETHVIDLFEQRTWKLGSFLETPIGEVRLGPAVRHVLARTVDQWRTLAGPWAEHAAAQLAHLIPTNYEPSRPLTGTNRRNAAARVRARQAASAVAANRSPQRRSERGSSTAWTCPDCGNPVNHPHHVRCTNCISNDPRQTPKLRDSRARAISARRQAEAEFTRQHPDLAYDPELWDNTIQPALADMKLTTISQATGVSKSTASSWRAGKTRPHISHWTALGALAQLSPARQTDAEPQPS
jgi:CRISPR-associated endonuclease Cas1